MPKNVSWLKLFFLFFLSLLAAVLIAGYVILNSSWFWFSVLKHLPITTLSQGTVQALTVDHAKTLFPAKFNFENIKLKIKGGDSFYDISLDKVIVDATSVVFKTGPKINCHAFGVRLQSQKISIDQADINLDIVLENAKVKDLSGKLGIPEIKIDKLRLKNLGAEIKGDKSHIVLNSLTVDLYKGSLKGVVDLTYVPKFTYELKGHFEKVDMAELRQAYEDVFSKLLGKASGDISLKGTPENFDVVKIYVNIPEEGQIKASLLKPLMQHIPKNSQQRKDLELLMKLDGFVLLDVANLNLESLDRDHLKGSVKLESNRFDLDVNLSTDINLEGGLMGSLDNLQKILSTIGGGV